MASRRLTHYLMSATVVIWAILGSPVALAAPARPLIIIDGADITYTDVTITKPLTIESFAATTQGDFVGYVIESLPSGKVVALGLKLTRSETQLQFGSTVTTGMTRSSPVRNSGTQAPESGPAVKNPLKPGRYRFVLLANDVGRVTLYGRSTASTRTIRVTQKMKMTGGYQLMGAAGAEIGGHAEIPVKPTSKPTVLLSALEYGATSWQGGYGRMCLRTSREQCDQASSEILDNIAVYPSTDTGRGGFSRVQVLMGSAIDKTTSTAIFDAISIGAPDFFAGALVISI